jgi:hypothetical protein
VWPTLEGLHWAFLKWQKMKYFSEICVLRFVKTFFWTCKISGHFSTRFSRINIFILQLDRKMYSNAFHSNLARNRRHNRFLIFFWFLIFFCRFFIIFQVLQLIFARISMFQDFFYLGWVPFNACNTITENFYEGVYSPFWQGHFM